jgi:arylsulfatase A-like enzyme
MVIRFTIKIITKLLIDDPNGKYKGVNKDLAQQIDIYPTIVDMIGYKRPIRSWGRSLISKDSIDPFVLNYNGQNYQYIKDNYICIFDGKKVIGFYAIDDKDLTTNLISKRNNEMNQLEIECKAYMKDYFDRIIDKKL